MGPDLSMRRDGLPVPSSGGGASGDVLSDVWWQRGSGGPRLLFLARLRARCTDTISAQLETHGVLDVLGAEVFPFDLLHQSFSDRYKDTPDIRRRLLLAGARVQAQAFTLSLDRLQCETNGRGSANVDVRVHGGSEKVNALVDAINAAIAEESLPMGGRHSAHVTVSYGFHGVMPRSRKIPEIDVVIDAFELVVGGGKPYRYTTLGRWELGPEPPRLVQTSLF